MTGYLICRTTSWGFTRYWWVVAKWIGTLSGILVGTALLGPWQIKMGKFSSLMANALDTSPSYDLIRSLFTATGVLQVLILIFIVALSVRKPWGKRLPRQKKLVHALLW